MGPVSGSQPRGRFIRANRFRKFGGRVGLIRKRSPHNLTRVWPLMKFRHGRTGHCGDPRLGSGNSLHRESFLAGRGTRLLADPSVACKSELRARRTAEGLRQSRVGVIAWSRTGDAELGDFDEEPVVLTLGRQSGSLPPSSRRAA
jgi:hypothetical protein